MNSNWPLIGAVVFNLAFSTIGDVCAKLWGTSGSINWFYIGLGVNIFTIIGFMLVVRWGGLGIATAVVLVLTLIINVSVGYLVFKEPIVLQQWLGIALGLLAIALILNVVKLPQ